MQVTWDAFIAEIMIWKKEVKYLVFKRSIYNKDSNNLKLFIKLQYIIDIFHGKTITFGYSII